MSKKSSQLHSQERQEDVLSHKNIYLTEGKRRFPSWLLALAFSAMLLFVILGLAPNFLQKSAKPEDEEVSSTAEVQERDRAVYRKGDSLLIKVGECPLYDRPAKHAVRLSSALYGELLEVLEIVENGNWLKVRMADGFQAYLEAKNVSADLAAVQAEGMRWKALVLNPYKRVMSHTIDGYALLQAPMGTLLYADYATAEVLRIRLPEDETGWVSLSGLRLLEPTEAVPQLEHTAALFASSAMNFYRSPYVPGGMGRNGADMAAVIFVSARVNGLDLPRDLERQAQAGEAVEVIRDVTTGLPRPQLFATGDVLFFHEEGHARKISQAAIILEEGQALTILVNDSVLNIRDLSKETELLARLHAVRRFFP